MHGLPVANLQRAIREIASQHARLSRLVEELSDSAIKTRDIERERRKFLEVIEFTERHFRFEEELMASAGYRLREHHESEHARLLADLARWREALPSAGAPDLFQRVEWLWRWLLGHIDREDAEFLDWLQYQAAAA